MALAKGLAIAELLGGLLTSFWGLGQAEQLRTKIGKDLGEAPLSLGRGAARGILDPKALQMFGLTPDAIAELEQTTGALPIMLALNEAMRRQEQRMGAFTEAKGYLEGMPIEPWGDVEEMGMIEGSVEQINRASEAAGKATQQQIVGRGGGRGLYAVTEGGTGRKMLAATERGRATRELKTKRKVLGTQMESQQAQLLANLQMQRPVESVDWGAMLGPALNWPLQKANIEIGVGAIPIQTATGMGQGMMQGANQWLSALFTPTPEAPSGIPGMIGDIGGAVASTKAAWSCIDAVSEILTIGGYKPLSAVRIGEQVFAGDNTFAAVVWKDLGTHAAGHRPQMFELRTREGRYIVATGEHVVGGKPIAEWKLGQSITADFDKTDTVASCQPIAYRPCGDLVLEDDKSYWANGFEVTPALTLKELVEMELAVGAVEV